MDSFAIRRLAFVLTAGTLLLPHLFAQSETGRARIALYEPAGQKEDSTLAAVLATVTDSVELSLDVLQRYDVKRLPPADPAKDLSKVRAYCETNKIDQAILGSGAARTAGGYDFRLVVYDRRKDSITVDTKGSSTGALDMFDTTDALVASLLDGLSGTHLLFGSLSVETDPVGAIVAVNGKDVGVSPVSLRGLPVGTVVVTTHGEGREDAAVSVAIIDGQSTDQALTLARSVGTLSVKVPTDAVIAIKSAEIGEKDITGSAALSLPTGDYDVVATDAGLPAVTSKLTISRNQASPWMPWTKAYLAIQPAAAGTDVTVDGQDRGAGPQVVEVDPGTLHRVTLKAAHYQPYIADLGAAAGDKITFAPELAANPGSIKVVTSIPDVPVDLDGAGQRLTPAVFDRVAAGTHVIRFGSIGVDNRDFVAEGPATVDVKPDEQALVSVTMVEGVGLLSIGNAPAESTVEVDGKKVDAALALSTGVQLPAGDVEVTVNGPASQRWTMKVNLAPASKRRVLIDDMVWHLPRRTIRMDGNPDDWKGLTPVWVPGIALGLKSQPGTALVRGFVCRDDNFLYVRYEFSNGTPTTKLGKDVNAELQYLVSINTPNAEIQAKTRINRSQGQWSSLGVWNEATQQWLEIGMNPFKSQIGESSLEVNIPLGLIKSYLKASAFVATLHVLNQDDSGRWLSDLQASPRIVAFDF